MLGNYKFVNGSGMPGLAGVLYPDVFHISEMLNCMLASMQHRGGKSTDTFTFKNIQMGCSGGDVAYNDKKNIVAILDGHIYNQTAIQLHLQREGFQFSTKHPAELIVHAYEAWGMKFPEKLDGDFAISIYDKRDGSITLVRDRIGTKPLYWYHGQNHFIFASELKALLCSSLVPQNPALDSIAAFYRLGFIPQDMSPIENVSKLLPGYVLHFSHSKGMTVHSYWSYSSCFTQNNPMTTTFAATQLDRMLRASTLARLPLESSVGCFVSGGLGSASVAYYVQDALTAKNVEAYTVGFQGITDRDIQVAKGVTSQMGISHKTALVTPENFLDDYVKVLWYLDEPLADPNILATWQLSKLASESVNAVFSGMGSDEFLAGHSRYTLTRKKISAMGKFSQMVQPLIQYLLIPLLNRFYRKGSYRLMKEITTDPLLEEYLDTNGLFSHREFNLASPTLSKQFDTETFLHRFHHIHRLPSPVSAFRYLDIKTRLPDCYILQYDRLTQAHGLDWRSPYFDRNIIEFLAGFPEPEMLSEKETASILKIIFKGIYPEDIVHRPKRTRHQLIHPWLINTELPVLFKLLSQGSLVENGLLSLPWLVKATKDKEAMARSFNHLWSALSLEVWFRLYINLSICSTPPEITVLELLTNTQPRTLTHV